MKQKFVSLRSEHPRRKEQALRQEGRSADGCPGEPDIVSPACQGGIGVVLIVDVFCHVSLLMFIEDFRFLSFLLSCNLEVNLFNVEKLFLDASSCPRPRMLSVGIMQHLHVIYIKCVYYIIYIYSITLYYMCCFIICINANSHCHGL